MLRKRHNGNGQLLLPERFGNIFFLQNFYNNQKTEITKRENNNEREQIYTAMDSDLTAEKEA